MSHHGADELSNAIDRWLSRDDIGTGEGLAEIIDSLAEALPEVADSDARERVRRRLAGVTPRPRSAQEVLLERAFDEVDRLQHRLREDEYVPWTAVATAAVVVVGAVGLAIWLRHRGIDEGIGAA
jgi:preprotein translocase subunit Sss1